MVSGVAGLDFSWTGKQACNQSDDPDLFFRGDDTSVAAAKEICEGCPFLMECRAWAVGNVDEYGVWGGTTRTEREGLRARRGPVARGKAVA